MVTNRQKGTVAYLKDRYLTTPESRNRVEQEYQRLRLQILVKKMREEAGISQAELARRISSKQTVISRIESKGYTGTSLNTLLKIAEATGHTLNIQAEPKVAKAG